jgi:hypothetical protein
LAKSWTGLIYLSSDPSGMRSLVLSLTLPFPELHVRRRFVLVFVLFRSFQLEGVCLGVGR